MTTWGRRVRFSFCLVFFSLSPLFWGVVLFKQCFVSKALLRWVPLRSDLFREWVDPLPSLSYF